MPRVPQLHIKRLAVHVISKPRHAVSLKCVFQHHVGDFRRNGRSFSTVMTGHFSTSGTRIGISSSTRRSACRKSLSTVPLHRLVDTAQQWKPNQNSRLLSSAQHERAKRGKYLFHCTSSHVMISGQSSSFSFSLAGFINSPVCALTIIVRYISRAIGAASASSLYSFVFPLGYNNNHILFAKPGKARLHHFPDIAAIAESDCVYVPDISFLNFVLYGFKTRLISASGTSSYFFSISMRGATPNVPSAVVISHIVPT